MALNIKDPVVHDRVKRLAELTGESPAQAVATAVEERLVRLRQEDLAVRLLAIGKRAAERMRDTGKPVDHGELLYDERDVSSVLDGS